MGSSFLDGLSARLDARFLLPPHEFTLTGLVLGIGASGPVLSCECRGRSGAAKLLQVHTLTQATVEMALGELTKLSALSVRLLPACTCEGLRICDGGGVQEEFPKSLIVARPCLTVPPLSVIGLSR